MRITIVGGGIAGLTLAAALDPDRHEVTLLEADPGRHVVGAGVALWPSALTALRRIGIDLGVGHDTVDHGTLHSLDGRRLVTLRTPTLHVVERPRLMAALAAAVPTSVRQVAQEVVHPATLAGDLVVGADGVRSRVRGLVHPPAAARRETPFVTLRGTFATVDPAEVGEYWGPGGLFGLAPLAGGGGYWFTAHRSTLGPEPLDLDAVVAEARRELAGSAPVVGRMLTSASPATIATRLWVTPPTPRYVRGRHVVIGDAAHASLPNLGRGACDAILDAVSLAATLDRGGSLRTWQARRLPVTQAARATAGVMMRVAVARRGHALLDRALGARDRTG